MFIIAWEFTIHPEARGEFERAHGPDGEWAQLFRQCEGYVATELLHDAEAPNRYLTLDYWRLPGHHVAAMARVAADYQALDARCAAYTLSERRLGNFVAE